MQLHKISILSVALAALSLSSCSDWLEQEPVSYLTPEGFYSTEDQVQAAANQFYTDVLPSHSDRWNYGLYQNDNETDNQVDWTPDGKYGDGTLWTVGSDNGNWTWTNIRNINYQLYNIVANFNAGKVSGTAANIRQYIGELYFFRAYCYFDMLKKWGDLPILTEPLADDEAVLVAASKRSPRNEVARFILADCDTALTYMGTYAPAHTRVSSDVVQLLKSRVALFEGSWLRNFKGTPFVPGDAAWPGAAKDYNASFSFPTGSIDSEAEWFFQQATKAAEVVAEKYKGQLVTNTGIVPQSETDSNPYVEMWGTTDMSATPEILLWRQYSRSLSIQNNVETMVQHGNSGVGLTRQYVESFLMKDGLPRYASAYTYSDQTIADVARDRDPRLTVFLKVPGQLNYFKNPDETAGDHGVQVEPNPNIVTKTSEQGYPTGYAIRKGGTFDRSEARNGQCENAAAIFRATEALLNYMEAEYELTHNLHSGHTLEYWKIVRQKAGFTGDAIDPERTIAATDMSQETEDWGAWTAGKLLTDATLFNIRRERRSEFIGEGMRADDLARWRSYDQLISAPVHMEGIHLFNTPQQDLLYGEHNDTPISYSDPSTANVSSPTRSEYLRPAEINTTNNNFLGGLTWHMAYYLQPLPIKQFLLTATDYATPSESPLYQNPYWPTTAGQPAEK